jgi:hypothetical protein
VDLPEDGARCLRNWTAGQPIGIGRKPKRPRSGMTVRPRIGTVTSFRRSPPLPGEVDGVGPGPSPQPRLRKPGGWTLVPVGRSFRSLPAGPLAGHAGVIVALMTDRAEGQDKRPCLLSGGARLLSERPLEDP